MSVAIRTAYYLPGLTPRVRELIEACVQHMNQDASCEDAFQYLLKDLEARSEVLRGYMSERHNMRAEFEPHMEDETDFLLFESGDDTSEETL